MKPNVIPATVAAEEKCCTAEGIYYALDAGALNGIRMGRHRLVYRDKQYEKWTPRSTGGRAHISYKKKGTT